MREIPVIRVLLNSKIDFRLFVHQDHLPLIDLLLPGFEGEVIPYPDSQLLVYTADFNIDVRKTLRALSRYAITAVSKHYKLFQQALRNRRPDLVLNDFIPFTPLFCRLHGIPVLGVYNYRLNYTRLGKTITRKLLSVGIRQVYALMYFLHKAIIIEQINPQPAPGIIPAPIIARKPIRRPVQVKQNLHLSDLHPLIFLSLGGGATTATTRYLSIFHWIAENTNWQIVLVPRSAPEGTELATSYPCFKIAPSNWLETQDIINAADLVIARAGFTTVAEALQARVPLLLWHMENHPEIRETEQWLLDNNLAIGKIDSGSSSENIQKLIDTGLADNALIERLKTIPSGGELIVKSAILRILKARYPELYHELEDKNK